MDEVHWLAYTLKLTNGKKPSTMIYFGTPPSPGRALRSAGQAQGNYELHDLHPPREDLFREVVAGLGQPKKALPCKLFYDAQGSALFEAICELDAYYPTRTEMRILENAAAEIAELTGEAPLLIELGSGSSRKTHVLLEAIEPVSYIPVDISREALVLACDELQQRYPDLMLHPICADYTQPVPLPAGVDTACGRRLVFFPGSTIGNFTPAEALHFLKALRPLCGEDGAMLIGVDLKKNASILNAAYNDARGVTAAFNLNLLARLNRELEANFDLGAFRHSAFYNDTAGRVEMHLVSLQAQEVLIKGHGFHFHEGERIHTENSYKYTPEAFQRLAAEAGYEPLHCWTDADELFSVHSLLC
jgi:dimethylhistidine N-methyltransferase